MNFLMQHTVTYSHPCKKYSGKCFLLYTWEELYKRYLNQPEFHKHGIMSKTALCMYKPKYILLLGKTPMNQCLCDECENCELLKGSLIASGVKGIPSNKYDAIDATMCPLRTGQFGSSYAFAPHECIMRSCVECGKHKLHNIIYVMPARIAGGCLLLDHTDETALSEAAGQHRIRQRKLSSKLNGRWWYTGY